MGVVSTSDSLDHTQTDLDVMRSEGAAVKEMEAAGCAWVALQSRVPFVAVKVRGLSQARPPLNFLSLWIVFDQAITDIVDGGRPSAEEFYSNLHTASEALQVKLTRVVAELGQTPLSPPQVISEPAPLDLTSHTHKSLKRVPSRSTEHRPPPVPRSTSSTDQITLVVLGAILAFAAMRALRTSRG